MAGVDLSECPQGIFYMINKTAQPENLKKDDNTMAIYSPFFFNFKYTVIFDDLCNLVYVEYGIKFYRRVESKKRP